MEPCGLYFKKDFLSHEEEDELTRFVYAKEWDDSMSRRTQHFGARYVYKHVDMARQLASVEPVPKLFSDLAVRAYYELFDGATLDSNTRWQVIVNEYKPRQGISKHIDDTKKFGPRIICVSLGADARAVFRLGSQARSHDIPARSVYAMTEDARYTWTHELVNNTAKTRVSITIRQLI